MVVDAPRLRFFDYNGKIEKVELKDLRSLVGAEISAFSSELCRSKEQWMGIVSAISSVQVLSVSSWFFQFVLSEENGESFETRGPMFKNLKEFRWDELVLKQSNMRAIIFFLRECPMLEALYIHLDFYAALINEVMHEPNDELDSDVESDEGEPSEPSFLEPSEPSDKLPAESNKDEEIEQLFENDGHLLSRLTMVSITQFSGCNEEMHFLEFILRKATILKLLNLIIIENKHLCGRIFCIPSPSPNLKIDLPKVPSASPDLEIDMWGKLTTKPRGFRIYRDLWDF